MREALLMFGFNLVLVGVLSALGWKFFLASEQNTKGIADLLKNPLELFFKVVVIAPLLEEVVFRGVPSLLLRRVWRVRNRQSTSDAWYWTLVIASSLLFAIMHGINDQGTIHLPLPQLVVGFVLWRTAINRGLRYSILMHATYNSVVVGLVLLAGNAVKAP